MCLPIILLNSLFDLPYLILDGTKEIGTIINHISFKSKLKGQLNNLPKVIYEMRCWMTSPTLWI